MSPPPPSGTVPPMPVHYFHLPAEAVPPRLAITAPFKAILVLEQAAAPAWRDQVSRWLLEEGCRYAMTWGQDCEAWHDSIDDAEMEAWNFGDVPDDRATMTTWHADEPLAEPFWFAHHSARHPCVDLGETLILHIGPEAREADLLRAYAEAKDYDPEATS